MSFTESETKILDIPLTETCTLLENLGAVKVFDHDRIITHFDTPDHTLFQRGKILKLTEEGTLKLTINQHREDGTTEEIKVGVSRKEETVALLDRLGFIPISEVTARRISYEWDGVDFDIDIFPHIPPFLEIDLGESGKNLLEILTVLTLENRQSCTLSTPEVFQHVGKDYFLLFSLSNHAG